MMMLIYRIARTATQLHRDERGLNTAELLGNAALAIVALVAIWYALRQAGLDIIDTLTERVMNEDLE
jgi:hypothetical protein